MVSMIRRSHAHLAFTLIWLRTAAPQHTHRMKVLCNALEFYYRSSRYPFRAASNSTYNLCRDPWRCINAHEVCRERGTPYTVNVSHLSECSWKRRNNLCIDFMAVVRLRWRCNICIVSRGCRGRAMTRKQAMFHEVSRKHSLMVAATFFKHPESEPSL